MLKVLKAIVLSLSLAVGATYASTSAPIKKAPIDNFTAHQLDNLHFAYQYGEQFEKSGKLKNDHPNIRYNGKGLGHILAGIAWQESSAGANLAPKKNHHAYGLFQNYLKTVKAKNAKRGVKMSDRQTINFIMNREVSAFYAMDELAYWLDVRNGNIRLALASYNAGWNYKAGLDYADSVLKKANHLKSKGILKTKRY